MLPLPDHLVKSQNKAVYDAPNNFVECEKLRPMVRLGGDASYAQASAAFELQRPNQDGVVSAPDSIEAPGPMPAFRLAQASPNPSYRPGAPVTPPDFPHGAGDFVTIEAGKVSKWEFHKLMTSAIVPLADLRKPLLWGQACPKPSHFGVCGFERRMGSVTCILGFSPAV